MTDREDDFPELPLGRDVPFPDTYDAGVLARVPRARSRAGIGIREGEPLPFTGEDFWRAWEFTWQDLTGSPQVAVLELQVPCTSPFLVESKSLKLYLHGYANTRFADVQHVGERISDDLAQLTGTPVRVRLVGLAELQRRGFETVQAESLDDLHVAVPESSPGECVPEIAPGALQLQSWHTDAFGSLCPVTGQPDWASVTVVFEGPELNGAALQRYLLAYRRHAGFHESCAEQIYLDLWRAGSPAFLSVRCRYTRRGGIDINPYRASAPGDDAAGRLVRQ